MAVHTLVSTSATTFQALNEGGEEFAGEDSG